MVDKLLLFHATLYTGYIPETVARQWHGSHTQPPHFPFAEVAALQGGRADGRTRVTRTTFTTECSSPLAAGPKAAPNADSPLEQGSPYPGEHPKMPAGVSA